MVKLEKILSEEQKNYLINNFGKLKVKELSKLCNLKERTITTFFKNRGMKLSKADKQFLLDRRDKTYNFNESYFSTDSCGCNYWAGFIAADGCITNNRLQLKLKSSDKQHLDRFKEDINSNSIIKTVSGVRNGNKFEGSLLYLNSKRLLKDLNEIYNISSKKSLTLNPPKITDFESIDAFIIGYFDGDGTIYKKKNYLCCRFYGTLEINKWIKERIDFLYGKNSGSLFKKNNIWCFELNPKATTFFGDYYSKIKTPKLKRKWDKFNNQLIEENA